MTKLKAVGAEAGPANTTAISTNAANPTRCRIGRSKWNILSLNPSSALDSRRYGRFSTGSIRNLQDCRPSKSPTKYRPRVSILHRIDSRKLRIKRREDKPDQILLQTGPPTPELQKHLDESSKQMEGKWLPMEMQMWAAQILEPLGSTQPQPQRWREMLEKARTFHTVQVEPGEMLVFGNAPTMVAAICLRD